MRRIAFNLASAVSLALFLWLIMASRWGDARRFWIGSPFGHIGPFDAAHESDVGWLILALGVLPLLWVVVAARRTAKAAVKKERIDRGCCSVCGYDLRATPSRCPECGTRVFAQ